MNSNFSAPVSKYNSSSNACICTRVVYVYPWIVCIVPYRAVTEICGIQLAAPLDGKPHRRACLVAIRTISGTGSLGNSTVRLHSYRTMY